MHAKRTEGGWSALNVVPSAKCTSPRGIWPVSNVVSYKDFEIWNTGYKTRFGETSQTARQVIISINDSERKEALLCVSIRRV